MIDPARGAKRRFFLCCRVNEMAVIGVVGLLALSLQLTYCKEWSYKGENGISHWPNMYPACGLKQQSPINIYEGDVVKNKNIPPFQFTNYDVNVSLTLLNEGYTASVGFPGRAVPSISGGGLVGTYKALQFHFHWGNLSTTGSEHLISSQQFPMELHILHYNSKYEEPSLALSDPDGFAMLAFVYAISSEDNANYTNLVESLSKIKSANDMWSLDAAPINSFLPTTFPHFYRYFGSLTTPSCQESVTWTVFKEPIFISEKQLAAFRTLMTNFQEPMLDNYRPVQPLNNREVVANYDPHIHWRYGHGSVEMWKDLYQECGSGSQSPIDINTTRTTPDGNIPAIAYYNYQTTKGVSMRLTNNGHAATVVISGGDVAISAGGLSEKYRAAQFHFHWGSTDMQGSEHTVDHKSFPMELHIVHYKSSLGNLSTAANKPRGLAVLGFFFEISPDDNTALKDIINNLNSIQIPDSSTSIPAFSLNSILPAHRNDFYRYEGSLTTPRCHESVIWTVFKDTIKISSRQLQAFRSLKSADTDTNGVRLALVDNYRPVQKINNRIVSRNYNVPSSKAHWSYEGNHGVDHWGKMFTTCENTPKSRQSPIDIKPMTTKYEKLPPFAMTGYDSTHGVTMEIKNNGHAVQLDITGGIMEISGGGLGGTYRAIQFHFHWGSNNNKGSEHTINGKSYPLEVHFVHYNSIHSDLHMAATEKQGLAVLGIMFEVSETDNKEYEKIIEALEGVTLPNNRQSLESIALRSLLPKNLNDFYRYDGSLTTPGCHETVVWTVFKETIGLSERQINKFREIQTTDPVSHENVPLLNNYRPVQPINNRLVTVSFGSPSTFSSCPVIRASLLLTTLAMLCNSLSYLVS